MSALAPLAAGTQAPDADALANQRRATFDLVVKLKIAKARKLRVSDSLLRRAEKVIR